jgi:dipeptidyl aminopeptidase/acylaminoacyl peptidase
MTTDHRKVLSAAAAVEFKIVQDAQISPDGALVAFEVSDRYKLDTKAPKGTIWIVDTHGGDARPFTSGPRRDDQPRWSPDSQRLAFLSDRAKDGQPQIYVLPRHGGEALALSDVRGHIEGLRWSADGRQIFFLMIDPQTPEEKMREETKDDVIEFEEHPKYAHVYALEVATKAVRPLTSGNVHAWEFDVAAGGTRTALVAADNPFEWSWYQSRISVVTAPDGGQDTSSDLHPVEAGRSAGGQDAPSVQHRRAEDLMPSAGGQDAPSVQHRRAEDLMPSAGEKILHESKRQLARPVFSPDGKWVAFLTSTWSDRGVTSGDLYVVATDGSSAARNLTQDYGGSVSWMEWSADSRTLIFLALESMESSFSEVAIASGKMKHLWSGAAAMANPNQQEFSVSRDGTTLAVARESATEPREVWLARRSGDGLDWARLTNVHQETGEYEPIGLESIHWKGADGVPIQGFLLKPHNYVPGKRYPMVTVVHGGPTSGFTHSFPLMIRSGWIGMLAAQGILVLMPNPRGSVGWGLRFAESNLGDMGGKDYADVIAGVDACVAAGLADEKRLGIAGWSYGGYMTMWTVSQTERFKAAMAGAGIANWKSFHGLTKYPTFDTLFYRADPYDSDKEAAYELFSPLTYVKRIKTPTLIVHGEKDPDVPAGQAYEFHRALKDHGVETQLVIYPRELHGFSEKAHILDMWERVAKWFVTRL